MRVPATILAAAALLAPPLAEAAQDPGLTLHDIGTSRRVGAGAQLSVTLPLGASAERTAPRLSLRAGPALSRSDAVRTRTTVAPLAELALRPKQSTTLSFIGRPLITHTTAAALRERSDRTPEGERQGISTLGIIAIGVGVAAIVGGLLFIDAVRDSSD